MVTETLALISLDLVVIIALVIILANSSRNKEESGQRLFNLLIRALIAATFCDLVGWILLKPENKLLLFIATFFNFSLFVIQNASWWIFVLYVYAFITIHHSESRKKPFYICSGLPTLLSFLVNIVNLKTGIIFYFDPVEGYTRGNLHILNIFFTVCYMVWVLILINHEFRRSTDEVQKTYLLYLLGFVALPIFGALLEQLFYGISLSPTFAFLGLLLLYLNVQQDRVNIARAEAKEALDQLQQSKINIMLSQIKPHFLFNTLNIIRALCKKNPNTAIEAVDHFSEYLRENMNSLELTYCVGFAEELHHVQNYLYIEQLRFGALLNVEYNIETLDFEVPSLSLQVLCENAVKHGISTLDEGGRLIISSYRDDDYFYVKAEDNGAGFDTSVEMGPEHVGLRNTRLRLKALCDADLIITSEIGKGTVSIIRIPVARSHREQDNYER